MYAGWLERDGVRVIPDELRPEFSVAVDAEAASADECHDWRAMYSRAARSFDFSDIHGYDGINQSCYSLEKRTFDRAARHENC